VVPVGRDGCDAFECKWNPSSFDPRGLTAMRALHRRGRNYLVAPIVGASYDRQFGDLTVRILHPAQMRAVLSAAAHLPAVRGIQPLGEP
jgi:hypothetical protein